MAYDVARLLDDVIDIAVRAGAAILEVYESGVPDTQLKADNSPLTAADLRSHELIVAALGALQPQWPVLSEEASEIPFPTRRDWSPFWLVDPLDGTKEFVSRNGQFTVNIALVVAHRPVLGVVHVPVQGRTFAGAQGHGAFVAGPSGERVRIAARARAAQPLRVAGSRSHGDDALGRALQRMGPHALVAVGSSLKFCMLAEGAVDLYPRFGPTSEWDTAAGQAVVEAAGGHVLALDSYEPLTCNRRESLLNPGFVAYADPALLTAWRQAHER